MPWAPPRHCPAGHPPFTGSRCPHCSKAQDQRRGTAARRGYDGRWAAASKVFLALPENRLCCCGCGSPATVVDHRRPHRGDVGVFWDRSNWQAMAKRCHDSKTATVDRAARRWG